jgi:hypothetical protein
VRTQIFLFALQTEPTTGRVVVEALKTLAQPKSIAVALMLFTPGVVLVWLKPRWGRLWLTCALLIYWVLTTPAGAAMLAWSLDAGYAPVQRTERVEQAGAVVGRARSDVRHARQRAAGDRDGPRLPSAARPARDRLGGYHRQHARRAA